MRIFNRLFCWGVMKTISNLFFAALLAASLSACAAGHSEIQLTQASPVATANPQGVPVKIVTVKDARYFDPSPPNPETPSLAQEDFNNQSLRDRAIGRKRNGYGMAMGDVVLPEGTTVAGVVKTAVSNGFAAAGYRIVEPGQAGYDQATPVELRIKQFWCWFSPGFWEVKVSNVAEVDISGAPKPAADRLTVRGGASEGTMAATESRWQEIASKGLDLLTQNTTAALQGKPQQ